MMYYVPFGWKSKVGPQGPDWDQPKDLDLDTLEIYERARQGLSQTIAEEEEL